MILCIIVKQLMSSVYFQQPMYNKQVLEVNYNNQVLETSGSTLVIYMLIIYIYNNTECIQLEKIKLFSYITYYYSNK